jgi:protein adenylyltransferase SelO-like protein
VLREYVVSEAMAALGIPTTRALAAVTTGEPVIRKLPLPGAILTRIAVKRGHSGAVGGARLTETAFSDFMPRGFRACRSYQRLERHHVTRFER